MPKKCPGKKVKCLYKLACEAKQDIEKLRRLLATKPELSNKLQHPEKLDESIEKFEDLDFSVQDLILEALQARLNAYVPYSNFKVGAAFKSCSGDTITGCNIENSSLAVTCCAERTALAKAISDGHTRFVEAAVVAKFPGFITPCAVCRQMMKEFAPHDLRLYVAIARDEGQMMIEGPDEVLVTSLYNIMPHSWNN